MITFGHFQFKFYGGLLSGARRSSGKEWAVYARCARYYVCPTRVSRARIALPHMWNGVRVIRGCSCGVE